MGELEQGELDGQGFDSKNPIPKKSIKKTYAELTPLLLEGIDGCGVA